MAPGSIADDGAVLSVSESRPVPARPSYQAVVNSNRATGHLVSTAAAKTTNPRAPSTTVNRGLPRRYSTPAVPAFPTTSDAVYTVSNLLISSVLSYAFVIRLVASSRDRRSERPLVMQCQENSVSSNASWVRYRYRVKTVADTGHGKAASAAEVPAVCSYEKRHTSVV